MRDAFDYLNFAIFHGLLAVAVYIQIVWLAGLLFLIAMPFWVAKSWLLGIAALIVFAAFCSSTTVGAFATAFLVISFVLTSALKLFGWSVSFTTASIWNFMFPRLPANHK